MPSAAGAIRAGRAYVEIFADTAALNRSLRNARGQLARFATSVKSLGASIASPFIQMQRAVGTLGSSMTQLGSYFTAFGAVASMGMSKALTSFAEFDKQMLFTQGIIGATSEEMDRMRERALQLGKETSFTAVEVATGMTELARAGRTTEQVYGEIATVMDLARGTMTEMSTTVQILVGVMNQFGLSSDESQRAADTLAAASNDATHNLEELGQAMKFFGPYGKQLGFTLEEVAAALNIVADNNIRATLGGRQLSRIFKELFQGNKMDWLKGKGMVFEGEGSFRNLIELFQQLGAATSDLSATERIAKFEELFGVGAAVAGIMVDNVHKLGAEIDGIIEKRGEAERLRELVESGIWGAFKKVTSAVSDVALQFGKQLVPAVKMATTVLIDLIKRVGSAIKGSVTLANSIAGSIIGFTALGVALLATGIALQIAAAAMVTFGGVAAMVIIPLIAGVKILTAVIGVGLAGAVLVVRTAFLAMRTAVTLTAAAINALTISIPILKTVVVGAMSAMAAGFVLLESAVMAFGIVMEGIVGSPFIAMLLGMSLALAAVVSALYLVLEGLKLVKNGFLSVVAHTRTFVVGMKDASVEIGKSFVSLGGQIYEAIAGVDLQRGLDQLTEGFMDTIDTIKNAIVGGDLQGVWEILLAELKLRWQKFVIYMSTSGIASAFDNITNAVVAFGEKFALIFDQVSRHVKNAATDVMELAKMFGRVLARAQPLVAVTYEVGKTVATWLAGMGQTDTSNHLAVMNAQQLGKAMEDIDKNRMEQNEKDLAARQKGIWDLYKEEDRLVGDLAQAKWDSQKRIDAAQEKMRKEAEDKRIENEQKAKELIEELWQDNAEAREKALSGVGGETAGTFSKNLADQILRASSMTRLEDIAKDSNKKLGEIARNTSDLGFAAGIA